MPKGCLGFSVQGFWALLTPYFLRGAGGYGLTLNPKPGTKDSRWQNEALVPLRFTFLEAASKTFSPKPHSGVKG